MLRIQGLFGPLYLQIESPFTTGLEILLREISTNNIIS